MAHSYVWRVENCERRLSDGVITSEAWRVIATTEDEQFTVDAYGSATLAEPDPDTMIPYDDVTEAQAITWAQSAIGGVDEVTRIQDALGAQLDGMQNPTDGEGLPWE